MITIFMKELRTYFTSAMGYIFLGLFLIISGMFFAFVNIFNSYADMGTFFKNVSIVLLFLVPILTMRLLSEERKTKTDQLLITAPIHLRDIILGKYLASISLFLISLLFMGLYTIILFIFGNPVGTSIVTLFIGFFLMGCSLISIGLFISALTESQIVAGLATFAVLLLLWLSDIFSAAISNQTFVNVLNWLSVLKRYDEFTSGGVLNISTFIYYIIFSSVFVFLTTMTLEKRRWS